MKSSFASTDQAPEPEQSPDRLVQNATEFLRGIEALRLTLATKEREAARLIEDRKAYELYLAEALKRVNTLEAKLTEQADISKQARSRDYDRYRESAGKWSSAIESLKKQLAGKELECSEARRLVSSRTASLSEALAHLEQAKKEQAQLNARMSQIETELRESRLHRDAMSGELCRAKEEAKTQRDWNEMQGQQLFERTHALESIREEFRRTADVQRGEFGKIITDSKSMEIALRESRQQCELLRVEVLRAQEVIKTQSAQVEAQGQLEEGFKRSIATQVSEFNKVLADAKLLEAELHKERTLREALAADSTRLASENQKLRELERHGQEIQAQANQVITLLSAELDRARRAADD